LQVEVSLTKENSANFLGIEREQCEDFWKYTLKYYFEGEPQEKIDSIKRMVETICYARLLRWISRHRDAMRYGDEVVDFCKNYLIENVPKTDRIYYDI